MPTDGDPPRTTWRNYLGPVVLAPRRRRFTQVLLVVWIVAAIAAAVTGGYDIVWVPLVGIATSTTLLLRDRAGRRRSI